MKLILEINNVDGCNFDKKKLKLTIEETVKKVKMVFGGQKIFISVALISQEEIKKLNKKYRNKNLSTDILSFGNFCSRNDLLNQVKGDVLLGEILICCKDINSFCQKKNILFEKEFLKVASHGVLHLLGFEHGREMFEIQKNVVDKIYQSN
jgi:probable rRNA maturation factor